MKGGVWSRYTMYDACTLQAKKSFPGATSRHHTLPGKDPALDIKVKLILYLSATHDMQFAIHLFCCFFLFVFVFVFVFLFFCTVTLQSSSGEKDAATMGGRKANPRCKPAGKL